MHKKLLIAVLFSLLVLTSFWWVRSLYAMMTVPVAAHGGQYVEGVVAQPRFINPLLAPGSSSTDRTITRLIYNSLFAYNQDGFLVPDLAEHFERSDDGKEYTVYLRQDVLWHDGEHFSADDVIYTGTIAKNPDYGVAGVLSDIRLAWRDVTVSKRDDYTVVFSLTKPRADFLHTLTLGILPEHIWSKIPLEQFNTSDLNVKPVGTGPYAFVDVRLSADNTVHEYILRSNKAYFKAEPYITKFIFRMYPDRHSVLEAYKDGALGGVVLDLPEQRAVIETVQTQKNFIALPSYFAVFFNQTKSVPLAYDEIREALVLGVDRDSITTAVFDDIAQSVRGPLLPPMRGFNEKYQQPQQDIDHAKVILDNAGWKEGSDGIRHKGDDKLAFTLVVREDQAQLVRIAELLKQQWQLIGADVTIRMTNKAELASNILNPREYQAIIYAHPLRWDQPNLKNLWHSDSREGNGKNYALLHDVDVDQAIEALEKELDFDKRAALYETIQKRIFEEDPAVFLFAPGFLFAHTDKLHGSSATRVNVSYDRFCDVEQWYVEQKRARK